MRALELRKSILSLQVTVFFFFQVTTQLQYIEDSEPVVRVGDALSARHHQYALATNEDTKGRGAHEDK